MAVYKKDPNATLDYTFDWSPYLLPMTDTLDAGTPATWTVTGGLTQVSASQTGTTASVFVSGGTVGEDATIACRITTVGGRIDERTITVKIVER